MMLWVVVCVDLSLVGYLECFGVCYCCVVDNMLLCDFIWGLLLVLFVLGGWYVVVCCFVVCLGGFGGMLVLGFGLVVI